MSNADPFWVIERRDLKPSPKYLVVRREPSGFIRDFWMPDIGDATKWETQELALAHWRDCQCSDPALHVCEHSMIGTMSNADLIAALREASELSDANLNDVRARVGLRTLAKQAAVALSEKAAQVVARAKDMLKMREDLIWINDELEDEGDRVYFGSTNHAEVFRDLVGKLDDYSWADILKQGEGRDLYCELRESAAEIARLTSSEAALSAEIQRLNGIRVQDAEIIATLRNDSVVTWENVARLTSELKERDAMCYRAREALEPLAEEAQCFVDEFADIPDDKRFWAGPLAAADFRRASTVHAELAALGKQETK